MTKRYVVTLTEEERGALAALIASGKGAARKLAHARVLLKADAGPNGPALSDAAVAAAVEVSDITVGRVRRRFVEEGLEAALNPRPSSRVYRRKLDGEQEAHLIALACGPAPDGHARWTLRLLADKVVELEYVDEVSHETVRQVLKKTNSSPGRTSNGASLRRPAGSLWPIWRTSWKSTPGPMTHNGR